MNDEELNAHIAQERRAAAKLQPLIDAIDEAFVIDKIAYSGSCRELLFEAVERWTLMLTGRPREIIENEPPSAT